MNTGQRNSRSNFTGSLTPYLFVIPTFLVYFLFVVYPVIQTAGLSFTNWDGLKASREFVGIRNYLRIFTNDPLFFRSFRNNLWWAFLGTAGPIVLALPLASILSTKTKGRTFFRTVFFMPNVLPAMVVGIIWGWVYNPVFGLLNTVLNQLGLNHMTRAWLGEPRTALTALIVSAVWAYFGFVFVIFMAAIQNVDRSLYEAAEIDGANAIQSFFAITIPQLKEVITMITVYTFIGGFARVFDMIWATTRGGPGNSTEVLATYIYRQAFQQNQVGYGSAMALTLSVMVAVASILFLKYRER